MSEDGKFSVLKFTKPVKWMIYLSANITTAFSGLSKNPMIELTIEPKLNVTRHAPILIDKPERLIDFTGSNAVV